MRQHLHSISFCWCLGLDLFMMVTKFNLYLIFELYTSNKCFFNHQLIYYIYTSFIYNTSYFLQLQTGHRTLWMHGERCWLMLFLIRKPFITFVIHSIAAIAEMETKTKTRWFHFGPGLFVPPTYIDRNLWH